MSEIIAAVTAVKKVSDIASSLLTMSIDSAVKAKVIELTSTIISLQCDMLSIQSQHQGLLQERDDLEAQLKKHSQWSATAEEYELTEVAFGATVYVPKATSDMSKPNHWLCANCFNKEKKSFLQCVDIINKKQIFECSENDCKSNVHVRR